MAKKKAPTKKAVGSLLNEGSAKSKAKTKAGVDPKETTVSVDVTSDGVPMTAPISGIKVRMYRTGLGDCFLLALPREHVDKSGRDTFYILIDCGVYFRSPKIHDPDTDKELSQEDWIKKIVSHIKESTQGRIDLLMITHEHWDHVSAFDEDQAQAIFESIELGALWLPWTEDLTIELSRKLKDEGGADQAALARASAAMVDRGMADPQHDTLADKVLGFFGAGKTNNYSVKTGDAMRWVQKDYASKYEVTPKYLHPGAPLEVFDGVAPELARIYVLGPPEDERVIKVLDRSGTTYRMGINWSAAATSFLAFGYLPATDGLPPTKEDIAEAQNMSIPFDENYQVPLEKVRAAVDKRSAKASPHDAPSISKVVPPEENPHFHKYFDKSAAWRKIDDDWAAPASALALQLDNKTNNTSLAFALEIGPPGAGKVLLFPGDAQIGNWLSWFGPVQVSGEKKPVGPTPTWEVNGRTVTAEDLLCRTVYYKVGHHGSHNATLRMRDNKPSGLMLMGSEDGSKDLVAMIPVDENVARNQAHYGEMPLSAIVQDVLKRTGGKVGRNDEDRGYNNAQAPTLNGVSFNDDVPKRLDQFKGKTKTPLYIEYTVAFP